MKKHNQKSSRLQLDKQSIRVLSSGEIELASGARPASSAFTTSDVCPGVPQDSCVANSELKCFPG